MTTENIDYNDIPQLSARDKAYQSTEPKLRPFYTYAFEKDAFSQIIENRKKYSVNRKVLVEELSKKYKGIKHSEAALKNINLLLDENTFTVVTAHQPSLLTGPLYYIYKICSAINLAKSLSEIHNDTNIVPVFIMGAEDHDFEEVNHLQIFNKTISWDRISEGSVGRLDNEGIDLIIKEVSDILGNTLHAESLIKMMHYALDNSKTYGEFSFLFLHQIFEPYGLIIANFDNISFKEILKPIIKKEIFENFSKPYVLETQNKLKEVGFADQAYAREINFFYFHDGKRLRIEFNHDHYIITDSDKKFSKKEMEDEIEIHPERFSPNVIVRPLFQEMVMPNLAYIGGGGELAYWMERKSQFEALNVFYPMLIRRKSALIVNQRNKNQLEKLSLTIKDLLEDTDQLIKKYALAKSEHEIDFSDSYENIEKAYLEIAKISGEIDPTLVAKIDAMKTSSINALEKIQERLIRTIKQNQEADLGKIRKLKDLLFQNDGLQERSSNFMEFYINHGPNLIEFLVDQCNPFEKDFLVIYE